MLISATYMPNGYFFSFHDVKPFMKCIIAALTVSLSGAVVKVLASAGRCWIKAQVWVFQDMSNF